MHTINNLFNQPEDKKDRIYKIVIPAIQRDYVQGLKEYSAKFDIFLSILFNALISKEKISLDFIYGYFSNGIFNPIDGQQRITTLALLYYYIVTIRQKKHNNNIFKHISYETRESATKFCKLLREDEFTNYLSENINKNITISTIIKNYYQYYDIYDYDLTIESMINSLDKIEKKYNEYIKSNKTFDIINNINFDNITFHIFPMEKYDLSDDLYIKMNGRGKQLSSFDNFKADYFKWLEENKIKDAANIKIKFNNEYIDIFWDFAVLNHRNSIPDPESLFFRFINRFITGKILNKIDSETNKDLKEEITEYIKQKDSKKFQQASSEDNEEIETRVKQFLYDIQEYFFDKNGAKTENNTIIYSRFDFYEFILQSYNENLINILDNIYNNRTLLKDDFTSNWNEKFSIMDNFNYKKLFIYNTILAFLEYNTCKNKADKEELEHFSRLVWNISEQYNIATARGLNKDNYKTIANRFEFIENVNVNENIYTKFINYNQKYNQQNPNIPENETNKKILAFIISDEVKKCSYIREEAELENKFKELESLSNFKGSIGFILLNEQKDINNYLDALSPLMKNINNNIDIFIKAIIADITTIEDLPIEYAYDNDTGIIKALITKKNIKEIAYNILNTLINNTKENIYNIHEYCLHQSKLNISNLNKYIGFSLRSQHTALYKYDIHNNYKLIDVYHRTYWLTNKSSSRNSDINTRRSYCPLHYGIVHIFNNICNKTNNNSNELFVTRQTNFHILDSYSISIIYHMIKIYTNEKNTQINIDTIFDRYDGTNLIDAILFTFNEIIKYIECDEHFNKLADYLKGLNINKNMIENIKFEINPFES